MNEAPGGTGKDARVLSKRERRANAKADRLAAQRGAAFRGKVKSIVITGSVLLAGVALVALLARGGSGGVVYAGELREGGRIDELRLPQLEGGGTVSYEQFRGKPLVVNFFASWCATCIAEMPGFEAVNQRAGGTVAFLGIAQSDAPSASIDLARETGISYPTALDRSGSFFYALGGVGMPVTVFIRPDGGIANIQSGGLSEDALTDQISQYLGVEI